MTTARLRLENITKVYPDVLANYDISLEVEPGQIHAVLGESGAGKTTLMRVIFGSEQPNGGRIFLDGRETAIESPVLARRMGISMVHQDFAVFETLTVAQNVLLGLETQLGLADIEHRIEFLGKRYGLEVDPHANVIDLSMEQRLRVEILRALMTRPGVLLLDESLSVLTSRGQLGFFQTMRKLADEGVAIVLALSSADAVVQVAHRCTVLRGGRVVASVDPREETAQSLTRMMTGTEPVRLIEDTHKSGRVVFELRSVSTEGAPGHCAISEARLAASAGEIIGIAGMEGNGQSRLMGVCCGELEPSRGSVRLFGKDISYLDPQERRELGVRFVPQERRGHGAVPQLSLLDNTLLTGERFVRNGMVARSDLETFAREIISRFQLKVRGVDEPAGALSDANLQKFIIGREILSRPQVLLVDQPTAGLDEASRAVIRNALIGLRGEGAAIIVVSEDIDELMAISDRIAVIHRGYLSPAMPKYALSAEAIGRWMEGQWPGSPFNETQVAAQTARSN